VRGRNSTPSLLQEYHGLKRLDTQLDAPRFETFQAKVAGGTESDMRHCHAPGTLRTFAASCPSTAHEAFAMYLYIISSVLSLLFHFFLACQPVNCKSVLRRLFTDFLFPILFPFVKQSNVLPPFSSNSTNLFSVHYESARLLSGHSRRAFSNWSVCNLTSSAIVISKCYWPRHREESRSSLESR
jgi:hypothetical protein